MFTFALAMTTINSNNQLSVTSDYDCILAMLFGLSSSGSLVVTSWSVPATSKTVSVIQRKTKCNASELTAPGSLNTCPMCEGQRWIFKVPIILWWYTWPPSLGLDPRDPKLLGLKACLRLFVNLTQLGLDLPTA